MFTGPASETDESRWGDYSMTTVDPANGTDFWHVNEYSAGGFAWHTRIGKFHFVGGPTPTPTPTATATGTATPTATPTTRDSGHSDTARPSDASATTQSIGSDGRTIWIVEAESRRKAFHCASG